MLRPATVPPIFFITAKEFLFGLREHELRSALDWSDSIVICFTGTLSFKLLPFLEHLELLREIMIRCYLITERSFLSSPLPENELLSFYKKF